MDDEMLLESLLCVADRLEDLLGPHGTRVMPMDIRQKVGDEELWTVTA
jgi:hypothetical protein